MNKAFKATILSSSILTSLALGGQVPLAAAEADVTVDEVIVTAQKRQQNLQEVPLAVQVIGADKLAAAGVVNFDDFNRISPSLVIRTDVQPINSTVAIRGIGTFAFGIGVEPSVAVVVDDVPLAFQARAFTNMADISRVEVLNGPQSTLYGKSATAGLINIVTPNPSSNWTAETHLTATNDLEKDASASISGPLTDTLAFRVSTIYSDFPGNVKDLYNDTRSDGSLTSSTHGKFIWTPSADFDAELNLNYTNGRTTNDYVWLNLPANADLRGNKLYPPSVFLNGVVPSHTNQNTYDNFGIGSRYNDAGESLKLSYDLGGPTLIAIGSHDRYFLYDHQDVDYTAINALDDRQTGVFRVEQWTEELRLVSPGTGPLRYTAGLFNSEVEYQRDFARGPYFSIARWTAADGSRQLAGYGQVDYDVIDKLTLTAGVRLGEERINYFFNDHTVAAPAVNYWSGVNNERYATYKVGPEYQLTDDIMLYGFHATGHKGETYDLGTGFGAAKAAGGPVHAETDSDYEIGSKMQFLSHRLTVNPTFFTTTYQNFQAQGSQILPNGTTNFQLTNVGRVRTRGFQTEDSFKIDNDWSVGLSATYLDATILSYPNGQCYATQIVGVGDCVPTKGSSSGHQDLSGTRLNDAPKWKVTSDTTYIHPLGFLPLDGVYRANYTYTGKVNYTITQDPGTIQKAYGILNLSAGLRDQKNRYEITFFVNNVLNKHYYENIADIGGTFASQNAIQAQLPRDFDIFGGVTLSAKF
jgi:iron complex outermembrane receptor protein